MFFFSSLLETWLTDTYPVFIKFQKVCITVVAVLKPKEG